MKTIATLAGSLTCMLCLVSVQGCATEKAFVKKDLASLSPLKVVRHQTPEIRIHTLGGMALGGLLLGGFGMEAVGAARGKALREEASLPDYGDLVMRKFVGRIPKEMPTWPKMLVEETPVERDYVYPSGFLLTFDVVMMTLYSAGPKGFNAHTVAELRGTSGEVLWRKQVIYWQKEAGRARELEELEGDNAKLLKEEMDFAAQKTVTDIIEDLRRER